MLDLKMDIYIKGFSINNNSGKGTMVFRNSYPPTPNMPTLPSASTY